MTEAVVPANWRLRHHAAWLLRAATWRAGQCLRIEPPGWDALARELDRWRPGDLRVWWRDDDATMLTPALGRLLELRARLDLPLCLAVIPARADLSLPGALPKSGVTILAHGWDHSDHSGPGQPKSELTPGRNPTQVREELGCGRIRLATAFGVRFASMLVPPFNQLAPALVPAVREAGFTHVSVDRDFTGLLLPSVNVHVDVMDWSRDTGAEPAGLVRNLLIALHLRRLGAVAAAAPLGVMTHHLAHDETAWAVTEELLDRLARHPAVTFPEFWAIIKK